MKLKFSCFLILISPLFSLSQADRSVIDHLREGYRIEYKKTEGKSSGWQPISDELKFTEKGIESKTFKDREKFKLSEYTISPQYKENESVIVFEASGKNKGGSTLQWSGIVDDSKIEGTLKWTNKSGTQTYRIIGRRK